MTASRVLLRTTVGLLVGLVVATVFSLWILLTHRTSTIEVGDGALRVKDLVRYYYVAGALGGTLAGTASVLGDGVLARMVIGFCATAPLAVALVVSRFGSLWSWRSDEWTIAVVIAVAMTAAVSFVRKSK